MPDPIITVGIDPGMGGAIAILSEGRPTAIEDMPIVDGEVSGALLFNVLGDVKRYAGHVPVLVEQVAAFPKNGSIGNFKLGLSYGVVLGVVAGLGLPLYRVRPAIWKRAMSLSSDKERSRASAIALWPEGAGWFKRKKDADRAEAALLGRYQWMQMRGADLR